MKNFDFSGFKKIAEDAKSVTMQHDKGHKMVIAIMAIPKLQREQLKMLPLAKGGEVAGISTQGLDVRHAVKAKRRGDKEMEAQSKDFAKEEAKGRAAFERETVKPNLKGLSDGGDPGKDDSDSGNENTIQPDTQKPSVNINVNAQPQQQTGQPVQTAATMQGPVPPIQVPKVATATSPVTASGGIENQAGNDLQGIQQGQESIKSQEAINAEQARAQIPIEQEVLAAHQQRARVAAQAFNDFQNHGNAAIEQMARGTINPNQLYDNMNSGEKIGTTIGLMLGGFGVPFGGHNFAYDKLQSDLNRDIDAQKKNADIKNNVWTAYKDLYGYTPVADQLTKASLLDAAAAKTKIQALQMGTPQAAAAAQKMTADFTIASQQARKSAAAIYTDLHSSEKGSQLRGQSSSPNGTINPQSNMPTTSPKQTRELSPAELSAASAAKMAGFKPKEKEDPLTLADLPNDTVLDANAKHRMISAKEGPYKEQFGEVQKQYDAAVQTDRALAGLNKRYLDMADLADKGGWSGYIHRKVDPHTIAAGVGAVGAAAGSALPGLGTVAGGLGGGAAGEAIGAGIKQITANDISSRYDAAKTNLLQEISTALKGTDVSASQIEAAVNAYAPEIRDSRQGRIEKLAGLRRFMINAARTSMLDLTNVSKRNP